MDTPSRNPINSIPMKNIDVASPLTNLKFKIFYSHFYVFLVSE